MTIASELTNLNLITKVNDVETKIDLFRHVVNLVAKNNLTTNVVGLTFDLLAREKQGSTAFENGLIIPHARTTYVTQTTLVIVEFNDVDFHALDGKPSNLSIAILVPHIIANEHLTILAQISNLLSSKEKLEAFRALSDVQKVTTINQLRPTKLDKESTTNLPYDFVGITSCAAGVAHTYMARDALITGAQKLGLNAKIETRGALAENLLTTAEIASAKFVIIASDVTVSKAPFVGKRVVEVSTNDAIRDAITIINKGNTAPVITGKNAIKPSNKDTQPKRQGNLVKALMSAISFMIPLVIVGGLLMAIPSAKAI